MKITSIETFVVDVTQRGNWIFVRLNTDEGITGIGEASQGGNDDQTLSAIRAPEQYRKIQNKSRQNHNPVAVQPDQDLLRQDFSKHSMPVLPDNPGSGQGQQVADDLAV